MSERGERARAAEGLTGRRIPQPRQSILRRRHVWQEPFSRCSSHFWGRVSAGAARRGGTCLASEAAGPAGREWAASAGGARAYQQPPLPAGRVSGAADGAGTGGDAPRAAERSGLSGCALRAARAGSASAGEGVGSGSGSGMGGGARRAWGGETGVGGETGGVGGETGGVGGARRAAWVLFV